MQLPETWRELSAEEASRFTRELREEVCETHALANVNVEAIARRKTDGFLFRGKDGDARYFIVHLTWRKETSPNFPWTTEFSSREDFEENWKRHFD